MFPAPSIGGSRTPQLPYHQQGVSTFVHSELEHITFPHMEMGRMVGFRISIRWVTISGLCIGGHIIKSEGVRDRAAFLSPLEDMNSIVAGILSPTGARSIKKSRLTCRPAQSVSSIRR
jgi:hypothetical protein